MRKAFPLLVAPLVLSALVSHVAAQADDDPWLRDLTAARALARIEEKPLLVVLRCER